MPDVRLTVEGVSYGGWKSLSVSRGIEQIAGSFEIGVSERWPDIQVLRKIAPGDKCTLAMDGTVVITGYVDEVSMDYSGSAHEVQVTGRDATSDLVDCSAIYKTGKWTNRKMEQIAGDLCAPFGITVSVETDTGAAVSAWQIQEGESVFECLERLSRDRGVLLVADGKGGMAITRASKTRVATNLVRGENILAASGSLSFLERFSQYIVKGSSTGNDFTFGDAVRLKAVTSDAVITRYRPLLLVAEDVGTAATLKRRAEWERNVRAGRSIDIGYTVQGWSHASGLWQPNRLVHVKDDWMRLDDDLLIKRVAHKLDDGGTTTELRVTMPQAFDVMSLPKPKGDKNKADNWWMLAK